MCTPFPIRKISGQKKTVKTIPGIQPNVTESLGALKNSLSYWSLCGDDSLSGQRALWCIPHGQDAKLRCTPLSSGLCGSSWEASWCASGLSHLSTHRLSVSLCPVLDFFKGGACLRPLKPWPLETPMMSIISSWQKTADTGTARSRCSLAQSTLSEMLPPFNCTSMMWDFFWLMGSSRIWN